jgi:hypothetical protein
MAYRDRTTNPIFLCAFAAVVMAYGWGYRGVVGHEGGAMVPGAMLGLALCLGAGRADWYRRAAVAGLFGAVGWAWGGSLSYMEQTFYAVSDSFPDVLYGYTMLFFLGALWAGIGGAILGLAFTLPRSQLHRFVGPFLAMSAAFLITYLVLFLNHDLNDLFERFTAEHMHDGDWFSALTVLVVCGGYAILRPGARAEALLFVACAVAWYIGYMGLTWFGGLSLGPPYRSESWGGILGVLIVLLVYLHRQHNRAALMLALYGTVGGGLAFALAVFVRHPVRVQWGPFEPWGGAMQWKIAEESFGLFMGFAIALGVLRFARGGLAPAAEDLPRKPLDVFAVFVMLVALMWINLRRVPMAWIHRYEAVAPTPVAGLMPWVWFLLAALFLTALAVYALYLYRRDALALAPATAYGKAALILILLLWVTVLGSFIQHLPASPTMVSMVDVSFFALAGIATAMALSQGARAQRVAIPRLAASGGPSIPPSDPRWRVGFRHALVWLSVPVVLLAITGLSMAMQDGPVSGARLRFGEHAYWREATRVIGIWDVVGIAPTAGAEPNPQEKGGVKSVSFNRNRAMLVALENGSVHTDEHRWHHADSRVWLNWYGREEYHPERATVPMTFHENRLYIPWPPKGEQEGMLVLERRP